MRSARRRGRAWEVIQPKRAGNPQFLCGEHGPLQDPISYPRQIPPAESMTTKFTLGLVRRRHVSAPSATFAHSRRRAATQEPEKHPSDGQRRKSIANMRAKEQGDPSAIPKVGAGKEPNVRALERD